MMTPFPEQGSYTVWEGVTYRVVLALPGRRLVLLRRMSQ